MDKDISYFLFVFIGLCFFTYGPTDNLYNFLTALYYHFNNRSDIKDEKLLENEENEEAQEDKIEKKYEDKYLDEIRKINKEFIFDEDEEVLKLQKYLDFFRDMLAEKNNRIEKIKDKLITLKDKLSKYESIDNDYCMYDDDDDDYYLGETKEERITNIKNKQTELLNEQNNLNNDLDTKEGQEKVMKLAEEMAYKFIVNLRLEKLQNCFVMEFTPLGNVLMIYNKERESFKYYSDNSIPYRYLEVVGRKYVKQFNCRPIFVDMEEELKLAQDRWEREKKEKETKEDEERKKKEEKTEIVNNKKNVFAKFKQYNKNAGGRVNTAAPPKNSIPNKALTEKQENEKMLLKDKANRYTYEGKFANFSFLKKVDRKSVNKKFSMTFADFKKMQQKL